jgi:hypothetical protein
MHRSRSRGADGRVIVAGPCRRHDGDMASINQTIIQAKVTLQDIEPPI